MWFLVLFFSGAVSSWSPNSWRSKQSSQLPKYKNPYLTQLVENELSSKIPLVISEEINNLHDELRLVEKGEKFLFMGGDCAETFREHSTDNIILNYQLFILSSILFMKHTGLPVVKIARMAGQF